MIKLEIDIENIEDAKVEKNKPALDLIRSAAKEVLAISGQVVFKRSYCNTTDDIFQKYDSVDAFEKDWGQWFSSFDQS